MSQRGDKFFQVSGFVIGAIGVTLGLIGFYRSLNPDESPRPSVGRILNPGEHVLLVGDSIGEGLEKPLEKRLQTYGATLTAHTQRGATAKTWASKLEDHDGGYDVILLSLGTNDAAGVPALQGPALDEMLAKLRSRGAKVYWIWPPSFRYEGLSDTEEEFRQMMEERGVPPLELLGPQPDTSQDPMHVHPTPQGYDHLAAQVFDALTRWN